MFERILGKKVLLEGADGPIAPCQVQVLEPRRSLGAVGDVDVVYVSDDKSIVLVVDDDPVIRMVVRDALCAAGFVVIEAADADAGLMQARLHQPDLIILDVMLPRVDGLTILTDLRRCADGDTQVLVFSATGSRNAERAMALGAAGYLDKPFDVPELVARVQQLVADERRAA